MTDCFATVSEVVSAANKRLCPPLVFDEESFDILKDYCSVIDDISEEFDGASFSAEINKNNTISIAFDCTDILFGKRNQKYVQLINRAISCEFKNIGNSMLEIKLTFPSLWTKPKP